MWLLKIIERLRKLPLKKLIVLAALLVLVVTGIFLLASRLVPPRPILVSPQTGALGLAEPLKVRFTLPVARRDLKVSLSPELEGNWSWQGGLFNHFSRTLVFLPDSAWPPDQEFTVGFANVHGVAGGWPQPHKLTFTSAQLPKIATASFQQNPQPLAADTPLILELDQANANLAEFYFSLEPTVELAVELDPDKRRYRLVPHLALSQGQSYKLIVERELLVYSRASAAVINRGSRLKIWEASFTTAAPPSVASFTPQGESVLPQTDRLELKFTEPMDREGLIEKLALSPDVPGQWRWQDNQTLVFDLSGELVKATTYSVSLAAGARALSGASVQDEVKLTFRTIGEIRLLTVSPRGQGAKLNSSLRMTFDQPVERESAQASFSAQPELAGRFTWEGNSMILHPDSALGYFTPYKVTLRRGIRSLYGLDLTSDLSFNFTTEEKVVLLEIKFDRQDRALSCEAAALKMALAYKGVGVTEEAIMSLVGFDPTVRQGNTWGDPDAAFVGDINGSQNSTGYGVHWAPIARAATAYRQAAAFSGWGLVELAKQIEAGNPVVVWGTIGGAYHDPWQTPAGKRVEAWKGEHTRTVIGFKGSSDNPTSFILNDPLAGRITWSAAKFRNNWAIFGYSGVVVF